MLLHACAPAREQEQPLVVFAAGSLARPLGAALDSFRVATGIETSLVPAGSLDLARRVTELGQTPDVIALADEDVFPKLLMPAHVTWYARFARNRMVLARRDSAATAGTRWWEALTRPGVETGRSDPDLDPAGYRTLMLFQLAERHTTVPGLAAALEAGSPPRNIRPKSAELVALLQAGELDYAWMYESSARGARLPFDTLPSAIDLGAATEAATYATAKARVRGGAPGDTIEISGAPITYGVSVPIKAARATDGQAFVRYLYSTEGQRILRREFLDATSVTQVVGTGAPDLTPPR